METITNVVYLIASVLFILGLKKLSSPKTARKGNVYSLVGMLLAIVITLIDQGILDYTYIIIGVVIGGTIGAIAARRVEMTGMPEMVALFNGFGGIASTFVAYSEYVNQAGNIGTTDIVISMILSLLIGTVTFTGSLIAWAKLKGVMTSAPIVFKGQTVFNGFLLVVVAGIGVVFAMDTTIEMYLLIILGIAIVLGVTSVIPIGGADMPVVISLLNSYSGLAACATGFVLSNNVLIIAGALVGASGLILTNIMCVAMNRSLANVLFAAVGVESGTAASGEKRSVTNYTAEDAAMIFDNAESVIIVPGYGLAVAQAQHVLEELAAMLEEKGINVRYAIHPVAGRMPGHMNVLLAEANVSYEKLIEMDMINDDFQETSVALVIGANDVINPAARTEKSSALYGMPILNCDQAQHVMIVKRSLSTGFAGEDNELFYDDKTMMLFGDAKGMVTEIVKAVKEL
ncbi:MAG: NAD(P)(+) transhydrogenase (Re/Si-specific) subunit beta [Calditrichaeota bacterium]|nr:MAG: NAD(P)(+) transhydrogenase (Re/Si-specific) subunit beta [Calditrichota bacterium]MBL1205066.1 NAD(P)(+) transhydrogenase (Re/Si-specific) subunit beta [Calditrichota bacterium]NOG44896.1 NAD(P)(+) transhydrogenase (Re/Si-specific) subunit beta [Calditrichota bacterium]